MIPMDTQAITLEDINEVIKYFATQLELRIEQLDQKRGLFLSFQDLSPAHSQQSSSVLRIIQKHSFSQTSNHQQTKLVKKFAERIVQIFQFFKQKTSRHSEGLLHLIENKIRAKLDSMIDKQRIDVGQVLKFAFSLTRKSALTNFLKSSHSHVGRNDKSIKGRERYLKSCATFIKVNSIEPHFEHEQKPQKIERAFHNQNHTVMAKLSVAKSHLNFQPFNPTQPSKQDYEKQKSSIIHRPLSSKPGNSLQRVSDSEENILTKGPRKYSLSKKRESYLKVIFRNQCTGREPKILFPSKFAELQKLYVGMDIDRKYIEKMVDKREFLTRDMTRRNQRILNTIKRYKRRQRTFPVQQCGEQEEGLVPGNGNKSQTLDIEVIPLGEKKNRNSIVGEVKGLGKRHSLRTMTYQNQMEKKRKVFDRNLSTRGTGRVKGLAIDNKENMECF